MILDCFLRAELQIKVVTMFFSCKEMLVKHEMISFKNKFSLLITQCMITHIVSKAVKPPEQNCIITF